MSDPLFNLSVKFEFGATKRMKLYVKLSQLLGNGVPLTTALLQVEKIQRRTNKKSILAKLYRKWIHSIDNGVNFGQCLAPYIPSSEAILLETGANSGKLVAALKNAADSIEQQTKVKKAIIASSAYPMVLVGMLIAALLMASYNVIPTFESLVPPEKWTGVSYVVAKVTAFIRNYSVIIFSILAGLVVLIAFSMPRWTSSLRVKFDNYAPWSLYRMWQGSTFLLAIASMMSAGVKLDEVSLGKITKQADPYLRQRVRALMRHITAGENLGDALFKTGYKFPDEEIISDIQIYANLRGFDQNLIWITKSWVDSLVEQVTIVMKVVNTVILMLIAVVIGCLITAFYDVFQQVQSQ